MEKRAYNTGGKRMKKKKKKLKVSKWEKKYIENVILWTKYLSQGLNNQLKGGFI